MGSLSSNVVPAESHDSSLQSSPELLIIDANHYPGNIHDDNDTIDSNRANRYIRTGHWILMLLSGYVLNRLCTELHLPEDAQHHTWFGHARNITDLILLGFLQGWLVGIIESEVRWRYLQCRSFFFVLFFATGPVYSIISSIKGIDQSVAEDTDFSFTFTIILSFTACIVIGFLFWHINYAFSELRNPREARFYLVSRLIIIISLGMAYFLIHSESNSLGVAKLHLHHYFVAWIISLFASFNRRISTVFLAITSGIFVQGISVYGAGSMFYRDNPGRECPEIRLF